MPAAPASATTFSFGCITAPVGSSNCGIGEAQLSLNVAGAGPGQVSFALSNDGPDFFSAAQIFFDDSLGLLASLLSVIDGPGVDFEPGGTPPSLPGGSSAGFEAGFLASATSPAPTTGVNPGEVVELVFTLSPGVSLADVLAALESETLHVGVHGIAFATGRSKAFVNEPTGLPEPAALALGLLGALGLARHRRR